MNSCNYRASIRAPAGRAAFQQRPFSPSSCQVQPLPQASWQMVVHMIAYILQLIKQLFVASNSVPCGPPKTVVVVGGGFAGLTILRHLSHEKNVSVVIVDCKDYWEYTPGILRAFVRDAYEARLHRSLAVLATLYHSKFHQARVTSIDAENRQLILSTGAKLQYDACVVTSGSDYTTPMKANTTDASLRQRCVDLQQTRSAIAGARRISIIGGGPVGVELAGEILHAYPNTETKQVTIVQRGDQLLDGMPASMGRAATAWLVRRGARVHTGVTVQSAFTPFIPANNVPAPVSQTLELDSGRSVESDLVFLCAGMRPNGGWLGADPALAGYVTARGQLRTDSTLRVGPPEWKLWAAGDVVDHPSNELKLAHTAEMNAELVAHNVLTALRVSPDAGASPPAAQLHYPEGLHGSAFSPRIMCVSLGPRHALLAFNGLYLTHWALQPLCSTVKHVLEITKVWQACNNWLGVAFWKFGDSMAGLMNRTVLPSPYRQAAVPTSGQS